MNDTNDVAFPLLNEMTADDLKEARTYVGKLGSFVEVATFLRQLRPDGPWLLTAIEPDGPTETVTAQTLKQARAFVQKHDGRRNLYYTLNPVKAVVTSKPSKKDIAAAEYLHADLDPREDESPADAKARYLTALSAHEPAASIVVDSGNGLQALWRLDQPVPLDAPGAIADVEVRSKVLMIQLGGTAGTQNVDRLLRLPGTNNLPNAVKRKAGRVPCRAKPVSFSDARYPLEAFEKDSNPSDGPHPKLTIDWSTVEKYAGWLKSAADLPTGFNTKGAMIVAHAGNLEDLNHDLRQAELVEKKYASWSEVSMALAAVFKADGRFTLEQVAAALMCDLPCNAHIVGKTGYAQRRAVERCLERSYGPPTQRVARKADWRECRKDGTPLPTMHNARVAITALGVRCSFNTFHRKILFGNDGDTVRHELQAILGEAADHGIIRLRQLMSDRLGVDLGDMATRDGVLSLALENCFNPVADMLTEAEGSWDGTPRLDRMAVDYLNCADTRLNRAMIRKMMIAAVRRVRQPGCKFDTITVLESPEGWNKSGAWRALAGDENFSDMSILGQSSREVQEQLAEVWIHENSDLAGMRKAEVESVKAFASRQVDIARPAYGRLPLKQKRHSIEVASTNNDEYLQSQTGNRRFWPLVVTKEIDLDKLRRDRLQLWGEAARYESLGESIVLDRDLWAAAGEEQERRRVSDPWEEIISDLSVEPLTGMNKVIFEEGGQHRVKTSDLLTHVLNVPVERQTQNLRMRLAAAMKRAGWRRPEGGLKLTIDGKQVRGYWRPLPGRPGEPEEPGGWG
jgi:predicted P-loop ATPase